ncbi:MAG: hypothetical protein EHM49_00375 [Deltaproteobacteria bacterium]|nr:MAG: hypothetical protein EHM49_00375 [Deltaproteobacteria bacterium]
MSFGKTFHTYKEAKHYLKKREARKLLYPKETIRKLSKKLFPRRRKLYHVGTYIDFLNFD